MEMTKKDPGKKAKLKKDIIIIHNKMKKLMWEINQNNMEMERRKK